MHKTLPVWLVTAGLACTTPAIAQDSATATVAQDTTTPAIAQDTAAKATSQSIPDLRTRTHGSDWPTFLGPTGDGKSPERVRTDWPLPIRWHKKIGEGYSMPSIARGRLYLFDRRGGNARLSCWRSETGEELWTQEYRSDYEDYDEDHHACSTA